MKLNGFIVLVLILNGSSQANATTWLVGPSRTYTMPSQVSTLVQNGDTVLIDAAVYNSDVARWSAHNLLLKGVGGLAHLKANGNSYGGKAIWVIAGNNTTVESIEFSLCAVPDHNGAGIRQEGIHLTVRHCYFHDNEEGILAGDNFTSNILVEFTEFDHNGYGDGYSHNLYINHVNSLTFQYNYSHRAHVGHELKSRAYTNYILYNRIANENGDASREIDLPNGGTAIIVGNEIEQGVNSQNSNIIGYGLEGLSNPTAHKLYLVNNTIVNDRSSGTFVSVQSGTALYKSYNNLFAGAGTMLSGTAALFDTSNNLRLTIAAANFVNAAGFDYYLLSSSPAINAAVDPGFADTYSLYPVIEYLHNSDSATRVISGLLDVGAHEYQSLSSTVNLNGEDFEMLIYPNPTHGDFNLILPEEFQSKNVELTIFDIAGHIVYSDKVISRTSYKVHRHFFPGVYFVKIKGEEEFLQRLIIE